MKCAYVNGGCTGLMGAPTYRMLQDVTQAQFIEMLIEGGIPFKLFKTEWRIHLPECNSNILFRSMDDPLKLVGTNLAWFGCDELSLALEDSWRRLEARLREPKAQYLRGFGGWTPNGFNWVWKRFVGPERISGYRAVLASPFENKAVLRANPQYYERLKASYDEKFYQQEVLGIYLDLFRGRVYTAFDQEKHLCDGVFNAHLPVMWTLDFNVDPMTALLAQDQGGRVIVLRELYMPGSNTFEMCEAMYAATTDWRAAQHTLYPRDPLRIKLYGDAAGSQRHTSASKSDYEVIREFFRSKPDIKLDWNVLAANPPVKDRVVSVNGMFQNAAGKIRCLIDRRCKELQMDMREVVWKEGALVEIDKKRDPKRSHISDAFGYLIYRDYRPDAFQRR